MRNSAHDMVFWMAIITNIYSGKLNVDVLSSFLCLDKQLCEKGPGDKHGLWANSVPTDMSFSPAKPWVIKNMTIISI